MLSPTIAHCPGQSGVRPLRAAETSMWDDMLEIGRLAEEISPGVIRTPRMPVIEAKDGVWPHPRSPYARDRAAWAMEQARGFLASARRDRLDADRATHPVLQRLHLRSAAWNMGEAIAATRVAARELRAAKAQDAEVARRIAVACGRTA